MTLTRRALAERGALAAELVSLQGMALDGDGRLRQGVTGDTARNLIDRINLLRADAGLPPLFDAAELGTVA